MSFASSTRLGDYIVEETLGAGEMATVIAVHHRVHAIPMAMKVLHAVHAQSEQFRERFLREGVTARSLTSEHVVRIWDTGILDTGQPYMVMERLHGTDLDELLQRHGPMPLQFVVDVARQAAAALAEAHAQGIVHRDLKPANLFLARLPDGTSMIKIVDFGISKNAVSVGPALTQASFTLGTPPYMAPEQILCSKTVDHRADIWSLGATLFELLTGSLPFEGHTLAALAAQILYEPARKVSDLRPELPSRMSAIIARCLTKDVAKRYANVGELIRDLDAFAKTIRPYDWNDDAKTVVQPRTKKRDRRRGATALRIARAIALTAGLVLFVVTVTMLVAFYANSIT